MNIPKHSCYDISAELQQPDNLYRLQYIGNVPIVNYINFIENSTCSSVHKVYQLYVFDIIKQPFNHVCNSVELNHCSLFISME